MAQVKNSIIAGDYLNKRFITGRKGEAVLATSALRPTPITSENVEGYELVTDEHKKSAASGVGRGLVGGALLGPVGAIAGAMSAKTKGLYHVAIQFKDGKKSLALVDDKFYKAIVQHCF